MFVQNVEMILQPEQSVVLVVGLNQKYECRLFLISAANTPFHSDGAHYQEQFVHILMQKDPGTASSIGES